MKRDLLAGL